MSSYDAWKLSSPYDADERLDAALEDAAVQRAELRRLDAANREAGARRLIDELAEHPERFHSQE